MNHIGIKFTLPKPAQPVHCRELSLLVNNDVKTYKLPGSATVTDEFIFAETDTYKAKIVDIDEYGNRSQPSETLSGNLKEDIRPAKPDPVKVECRRIIAESDLEHAKADSARKAMEALKVEQAKAEQLAKDEEAAKVAKEKIDADIAKKKQAVK